MALSTLDFASQALQLELIFEKNLIGDISGLSGQEKNWGFFLSDDSLLIQYETLPCVHIFEYDPFIPRHAFERIKTCYRDTEHQLKALTLLDLEGRVHNSCNPILWDKAGNGTNEYLVMVHNRYGQMTPGYNHWLVRMDAESFELTHISEGIVFGAALHHSEGHIPNVIIVGSISLVKSGERLQLLVLGGEGDKYAIYERINMDAIAWVNLQAINVKADAQQ